MRKHTRTAFIWLINLLRKHDIPFEIFGGFDAKLFGAKRALADIDVLISDEDLYKIVRVVKKYTILVQEDIMIITGIFQSLPFAIKGRRLISAASLRQKFLM